MATPMGFELLKQLFKKPATNVFPVTYCPDSVLKLLEKVEKGEVKINPPVEVPKGFRGKPLIKLNHSRVAIYHRDS